MPRFDGPAAANYAMKWALSRNPIYPDFSSDSENPGGGGDCTNFVSQSMRAGGWTTVDGASRSKTSWWAASDEASRNWASASWFVDFAESSGRAKICAEDDLELGDFVSMNAYGGRISHLMIVTGFRCAPEGREILYSAHSENRLNYPLELAKANSRGYSFLYWKAAEYF